MSNVVSFAPRVTPATSNPYTALIAGIATGRRLPDDVFWLKENAELLGILRASEVALEPRALAPFEAFYDQIEARLRFFPQYYRFLLSLCLDLEDLGVAGNKAEALCAWVAQQGVAQAELSDLQRAEARRLLARRGEAPQVDAGLDQRLHDFINRTATFAMPNKKAAYELTHIVFYLSEYGQHDPQLSDAALISLEYAGLLAYLDQNVDLLAEVCTALRFAGQTPSALWEALIVQHHSAVGIVADGAETLMDAYHPYLVTGWALNVAGQGGFQAPVAEGALRFLPPVYAAQGALRSMSECMFDLGDQRSGNWDQMRAHVMPYLGNAGQQVLRDAEGSSDQFERFFAGFARAM